MGAAERVALALGVVQGAAASPAAAASFAIAVVAAMAVHAVTEVVSAPAEDDAAVTKAAEIAAAAVGRVWS